MLGTARRWVVNIFASSSPSFSWIHMRTKREHSFFLYVEVENGHCMLWLHCSWSCFSSSRWLFSHWYHCISHLVPRPFQIGIHVSNYFNCWVAHSTTSSYFLSEVPPEIIILKYEIPASALNVSLPITSIPDSALKIIENNVSTHRHCYHYIIFTWMCLFQLQAALDTDIELKGSKIKVTAAKMDSPTRVQRVRSTSSLESERCSSAAFDLAKATGWWIIHCDNDRVRWIGPYSKVSESKMQSSFTVESDQHRPLSSEHRCADQ